VSNRSGFVVRGHGRLMAAKHLGLKQVPVDYQDYENDAAEWTDCIADNKIAEFASMDDAILRDLMSDIKDFNFDMELTGFGEDELKDIFQMNMPPLEEDPKEKEVDENLKTDNTCPKCGYVW